MKTYFPFSEYWWFYVLFVIGIIGMLAIDLGVLHRKSTRVSFKEASRMTLIWISLALVFNVLFYLYCLAKFRSPVSNLDQAFDGSKLALQLATEFLTGYIIEYSLSVDNLFVFLVVFNYFKVKAEYQHRILFYGILGALIMRTLFIALGSVVMSNHIVVLIFGGLLIFSGVRMAFESEKEMDLEKNFVLRLLKRLIPITTRMDQDRFLVRQNNKTYATPLFVALIVIEFTDLLFAFDSVPAIFAVTHEPLIVFTSNIFAILGLRSLFFVLGGMLDTFHFLKYGLSAVLVFVGLKMIWLNSLYGGKFPTHWSLAIIATFLGLSIAASKIKPKQQDKA